MTPRSTVASLTDPDDSRRLAEQQAAIRAALDDALPPCRSVAVIGYPKDGNVGNHMMWVATERYLRSRGIRIAHAVFTKHVDADHVAAAVGTDPVLFLGGVTMNRLWSNHRDVRREIAARLPDNPMISLPSTALFIDDADRAASAEMFRGHPRAIAFGRDERSTRELRAVLADSVDVRCSHDLALLLDPRPAQPAATKILWIARDDLEGTGAELDPDIDTFDWSNDLRTHHPRAHWAMLVVAVAWRVRRTPLGRLFHPILDRLGVTLYGYASRQILAKGHRILDGGKVLVTDRMHPHVLALLRDQPVVLLPDRFGKNRAVYESSTREYHNVHWADTPDEALATAHALLEAAS